MIREIGLSDIGYLLLYLIVFIASLALYNKYARTRRSIWVLLSIIIVSLLSAYRLSGTDIWTYKDIYDSMQGISFSGYLHYYIELGWGLLNIISPNFAFLLFISSFIFLFFSHLSIKHFVKANKTVSWAILLLVFYGVFVNIMRQMIACSIFAFSLKFLLLREGKKKRYGAYYFWIIVAFLFHKSAFLLLFVPLITLFQNKRRLFFVIILSSLLVPFLSKILLTILIRFDIYSNYVSKDASVDFSFILCLIPPTVLMMVYIFGKTIKRDKSLDVLVCLFAISFPLQVFGFMVKYADRLTYYFFFLMILIVPMIIERAKTKKYFIKIRELAFLWYPFYFLMVFFVVNLTDMFPYIGVR